MLSTIDSVFLKTDVLKQEEILHMTVTFSDSTLSKLPFPECDRTVAVEIVFSCDTNQYDCH